MGLVFCLCLTAWWDYTPPCVLINGQAVVFFAGEKSPPTTSFPRCGKVYPVDISLRRRGKAVKYTFQGTEIEGGVPQIIDDELFDEVQRVLARYAAAPSRGKAKVERKQGIARHNRQRKSNADKLQLCRYSQMAVAFPNA